MMKSWANMIAAMQELKQTLKSDVNLDDKLNVVEIFITNRDEFLSQPGVLEDLSNQDKERYRYLDLEIKDLFGIYMSGLKEKIDAVAMTKKITNDTKRANRVYMSNQSTVGGYFIDKKK